MKKLNNDIVTRDKIIYGKYRASAYRFDNVRKFSELTADCITELLNQNFIDVEQHCGNAPTVLEIYEFLKKYTLYTAHGYTTDEDNDNYGVYITGVEKGIPSDSVDEFQDFMSLFSGCDELDTLTMWCEYNYQ